MLLSSFKSVGVLKPMVFIFLLFIFVALSLGQLDDDLSDDARTLLACCDNPQESEAYLYLLGILANEKDQPDKLGRVLLEDYRKREFDDTYTPEDYPEDKALPLPDGELFCIAWEPGCYETLFMTDTDISELINTNKIIVERAKRFHQFTEFQTLVKPSFDEPIQPYWYVGAAERLAVLKAIYEYKNGEPEKAIDSLFNQIDYLRRMFELQDNLVGAMVYVAKISEVIDITSIILSISDSLHLNRAISSLSQSEKSLERAAEREFAARHYLFKALDGHPEFFEAGGEAPSWYVRLVFKPNMTSNAGVSNTHRFIRLSQMKPKEFADAVNYDEQATPPELNLRNLVGYFLVKDMPSFDEYVGRVMDLNVKIHLFNRIHYFSDDANNVSNPYGGDAMPRFSGGAWCLDGPLEDQRRLRCLKIGL